MSDFTDPPPVKRSGATEYRFCPCHDLGSGLRSANLALLNPASFRSLKPPSTSSRIFSAVTALWITGRSRLWMLPRAPRSAVISSLSSSAVRTFPLARRSLRRSHLT